MSAVAQSSGSASGLSTFAILSPLLVEAMQPSASQDTPSALVATASSDDRSSPSRFSYSSAE
jgi:hypothetical protein